MTKITKYGITCDEVVSITADKKDWHPLIENALVGRAFDDVDKALRGLTAQNVGLIYDHMFYEQFTDPEHTMEMHEYRVMFKRDRDRINKMNNEEQQKALKEFVTGKKEE